MTDHQMTGRVEMRWTTVRDERGEYHLQARWIERGVTPAATSVAPAALAAQAA